MNPLATRRAQLRLGALMLLTILLTGSAVYAQQINRAAGRPATASSSAGASYTPDRAVDGSTSTRWSSAFSNSEWWSVDLGASYSVTKVVINWEAAYATAYDLQVSADGVAWTTFFSGTNSFPANAAGTSTAVTPASVSAVGRYVRVVGKNRATVWGGQWGYSAYEIQVFGDPPLTPPASPSGPSPANSASGVLINTPLGWSAASGATSYNVAFGTSNPPPSAATGLTATSFQPTVLAYSTTYYWRITAMNAAGSTAGPIWSFTTGATPPPPPAPPMAPAGPSPASSGSAISINTALSWSAANGATSYNVAFGASNPPAPAATGLTVASFQPASVLAYSTTYFWQITAVNAAGSTASPIWSFTTAAAPPPPPPPINNTVLKRLRVMTWNVAQGYTLAGQHDEDDQIDLIASLNPDVVILNEMSLADNDMPTYYTAGLKARTGKDWHRRFTQAITGAPPANAQGTMILTWLPVDDESSDVYCALPGDTRAPTDSSCTGFIRVAVTVNSVPLQIVGAHLNVHDATYRSLQLTELKTWLAGYGANQLIGGDFNAEPDDSLWATWLTSRRDVWAQASAATGEPGFTKDKRTVTLKPGRIDYQFVPADPTHIGLQQIGVVHTVLSDHHAIVADYIIQ